ncbi:hypothetical protein T440DRAFT_473256 [Plenodomus tracheiphilus IPT5]|uniref:Uncharacterized protein n=1 Tax=Plenodomus tracheiphilus IPT5 TaxID=1408161 RepID=A0A6A7ANE8_9PLEO|nr:hypothetical protein T440DRAFT_473256 [Plenodomus tracheiphilus IPT5]
MEDEISVAVETGVEAFHLPEDSENVLLVMIAKGTGLAPFSGFFRERAAQIAMGRVIAPAFLFYGFHAEDDCVCMRRQRRTPDGH